MTTRVVPRRIAIRVVKVGGCAVQERAELRDFASAAASLKDRTIVVHGGGPELSEITDLLGVPSSWSEGRRVTPPEALDAAVMVLSGRINKRIVGALVSAGMDALGISGEDGSLLAAVPVDEGVLGRVGTVERVRLELLVSLVSLGLTPVISPISRGPGGRALNVNADEAAAAIAIAVEAAELDFITAVSGVRDEGGRHREMLDAAEVAALTAGGAVSGGMAVKLRAARTALNGGVGTVRIGTLAMLTDSAAGTRVCNTAGTRVCSGAGTRVCNAAGTRVRNTAGTRVCNAERTRACNAAGTSAHVAAEALT